MIPPPRFRDVALWMGAPMIAFLALTVATAAALSAVTEGCAPSPRSPCQVIGDERRAILVADKACAAAAETEQTEEVARACALASRVALARNVRHAQDVACKEEP